MNTLWLSIVVVVFSTLSILRMVVFMIGSDWYYLKDHFSRRKQPGKIRTLSVIIPAHNEEKSIAQCVQSVINATYPATRKQIIVVNDGSDDNTEQIAQSFGEAITYVRKEKGGKASALNLGITEHATGELIMCLDADSTIDKDALVNTNTYFNDPRVVATAANVTIRDDGTLLGLIQKIEYIIGHQAKRAVTLFNVEYIIGGVGSTFRRSILKSVQNFSSNTITEDIDLTMKILRRGNKKHRVVYATDVIAETEPVQTVEDLIKQRFRWKYGRSQAFYKHRSLFFRRGNQDSKLLTWVNLPSIVLSDIFFVFEPLAILFLIYIIIVHGDIMTLAVALGVITTYVVLNIAGEETLSWKRKIPLIIFAPLMYFAFYVLSFVEYMALIKSIDRIDKVKASVRRAGKGWIHVQR